MYDSVWYKNLVTPALNPPAWIFPPIWTILYITLFVSLLIYGLKPSEKSKIWGYILFFVQLALNFCWSPAFFYLHNIAFAFAIVVLMDILTILTIIEFYKISKTSARCLIPYLIWILFATYLNMGFLVLN